MRDGLLVPRNLTLSARDRRVAEMVAAGRRQREIAAALGVSERTVRRVASRPDVRALASRLRQGEGDAGAVETLRSALLATRRDGEPDWQTRVSAARALLTRPEETEPPESEVPPGSIVLTAAGQDMAAQ